MTTDRYENQLLYLIAYYNKETGKAEHEVNQIIERNVNSFWSKDDENLIAKWRENIKKLIIKKDQTWVCLNHYRSLIGVNDV